MKKEERMERVMKELGNLLQKLSEDGDEINIDEIEQRYEKIKLEFGQWFTEDMRIFVAS